MDAVGWADELGARRSVRGNRFVDAVEAHVCGDEMDSTRGGRFGRVARVPFEPPFDEAMLVAAVLPARLTAGIVRSKRILTRGGRDRQNGPPFTATTGGGPRGLDRPYRILRGLTSPARQSVPPPDGAAFGCAGKRFPSAEHVAERHGAEDIRLERFRATNGLNGTLKLSRDIHLSRSATAAETISDRRDYDDAQRVGVRSPQLDQLSFQE